MAKDAVLGGACPECNRWVSPKWRACPTCAAPLPNAPAVARNERIAAIVAGIAGLALIIAPFLTWATITVPGQADQTKTGMSNAGRGIITLLIGVAVLVFAVLALLDRRPVRDRITLLTLGIVMTLYGLFIRTLYTYDFNDIKFKNPKATLTLNWPLWMLVLAGIAVIVASRLLPSQRSVKEPAPVITTEDVAVSH
jgi:hypothetical protein